MQGGITYAKSGCQEIGRICYGSNFNQVLEKEKNRLIHQYDKELTDLKKEYKSQAAYDKENGYDFTWSYGDEVQCKVTNAGFYPVSRKEFKKDLESMNFNNDFYVRDNGKAIFYADPYALGPYAAGYIQVSAVIK